MVPLDNRLVPSISMSLARPQPRSNPPSQRVLPDFPINVFALFRPFDAGDTKPFYAQIFCFFLLNSGAAFHYVPERHSNEATENLFFAPHLTSRFSLLCMRTFSLFSPIDGVLDMTILSRPSLVPIILDPPPPNTTSGLRLPKIRS